MSSSASLLEILGNAGRGLEVFDVANKRSIKPHTKSHYGKHEADCGFLFYNEILHVSWVVGQGLILGQGLAHLCTDHPQRQPQTFHRSSLCHPGQCT